MSWWKILLISVGVLVLGGIGVAWYVMNIYDIDPYIPMFADNCASCHGAELQGSDRGPALVDVTLNGGDSVSDLQHSISNAHLDIVAGGFAGQLSDVEMKGLAIYVGERRMGQAFTNFQFDREMVIPSTIQSSDEHSFSIETVIDGLDPLIFSIEPLPDGTLLVSEKERGLSIVSRDGTQSDLIEGTPATGGSFDVMGIQYGSGWHLDVAAHPEYEDNGWIYLHYTELCAERCNDLFNRSSMNRVDRGRIVDGKWQDVETIWQAPLRFYSSTPDTGAGGRIAFDDSGHVYLSIGIKSSDEGSESDTSPQDLSSPYGKIHRVDDDGSIPLDNPFAVSSGTSPETEFYRQSIWTFGHRSPQGLEWNQERGRIWNSEMGPRGGDEVNELLPGRNYGWPYDSLGLEYSTIHVERYKQSATEFDTSEVEQTLVDITPSPGISSFAFYTGDQFPSWQGNVLIGSLKGSSLYRIAFDGKRVVHRETLIRDLARIRDVEIGYDGLVYLLLENKAGSAIVRLVPAISDHPIAG